MNDFLRVLAWGGVFAVPFLTMFVVNDYFFPFITGKNFAFRIIVEIAFVAWALLAVVDAKYRPRFSWLLTSFATLLIVMFFANAFGRDPQTSFWSNFERMDGYVTLVHVFLYVVVLGSLLTTKKHWNIFLNTTLGVAFVVAMYGLSGQTAPGARIESFLGNSAYLAIYMFFHIYIAFWLFVEHRSALLRTVYGLLAFMFIYTLIETGTRGTTLGLISGTIVMVGYIGLFGSRFPEFRKYAIGAFVLLLVAVGSFYSARDSDFIQSSPNLARIANIDLGKDLEVRGTIWGMAWSGVKERPLLGWGQSNFNYIFNEQYDPFLYGQEQWFDRVHNIFLDWLVTGGFLGLIAYLSIFVACVYYLIIVPLRRPEDQTFTTLERGVILGILAGYMTHNLVVFDNIISYIFFAVILALIHSRVGEHMPQFDTIKIDKNLFNQFVVPVAMVLVGALIYTMHVPGILAAGDIIDGYRSQTAEGKLAKFELALSRGSFAHQEITEQIAQQAMGIGSDANVKEETRQKFITRAEEELNKLVAEKPGDARVHVFFSTFYRALGNLDEAATQMDIARELSPRKQSIIMQQAIIKYSQGDMEKAKELFREAFILDERNDEAREYYAAMLFAIGEADSAKALITEDRIMDRFAMNDFILSSVNSAGDTVFLSELYESRIKQQPDSAQNWASLAFLYYQNKDNEAAISTLESAKTQIPTFAKAANCFIDNIKAGNEPQEGCQN
ncbi:MAG: O-antigen ligase family protein [Candidatus Paceibacterota bacterium]